MAGFSLICKFNLRISYWVLGTLRLRDFPYPFKNSRYHLFILVSLHHYNIWKMQNSSSSWHSLILTLAGLPLSHCCFQIVFAPVFSQHDSWSYQQKVGDLVLMPFAVLSFSTVIQHTPWWSIWVHFVVVSCPDTRSPSSATHSFASCEWINIWNFNIEADLKDCKASDCESCSWNIHTEFLVLGVGWIYVCGASSALLGLNISYDWEGF